MAKVKSKSELEKAIVGCFVANPNANKLFVTSDGNCFFEGKRNHADLHSKTSGFALKEVNRADYEKAIKEASSENPKEDKKTVVKKADVDSDAEAKAKKEADEKAEAEAKEKADKEAAEELKAKKIAEKEEAKAKKIADKLKAVESATTEEELIELKIDEKNKEVKDAIKAKMDALKADKK